MPQVFGRDLRPGDTLSVWWTPKRDTILVLAPYTGLPDVFKHGARLARFAINAGGMTIDNSVLYEVIARGPESDALAEAA